MVTLEQLIASFNEIAVEAELSLDDKTRESIRRCATRTYARFREEGALGDENPPQPGSLQWPWYRYEIVLEVLTNRIDPTTELPDPPGFEDLGPEPWRAHERSLIIYRRWTRTLSPSGIQVTIEDTARTDGQIRRHDPRFKLPRSKCIYTRSEAEAVRDGLDEALELNADKGSAGSDSKRAVRRGRRRRKDIDLDTLSDPAIAYDVQAAADMLSLSYTEVKRAMEEGSLVAKTRGTKPLLPRAELERWLENLPAWIPPRYRERRRGR